MMVPLVVFGSITIESSRELLNTEMRESTRKTLRVAAIGLEQLLVRMVILSNSFYLDPQINKILLRDSALVDARTRVADKEYVSDRMESLSYQTGEFRFMFRIVGNSGREFRSYGLHPEMSPLSFSSKWYGAVAERPGRIEWVLDDSGAIMRSVDDDPVIVGTRVLQHLLTGEPLGVLAVGIQKRYVEAYLDTSVRPGEQLVAIERDRRIIASGGNESVSFAQWRLKNPDYGTDNVYTLGEEEYLLTEEVLTETAWRLVLLTPVDRFFGHVFRWQFLMVGLLALSVVLSVTFSTLAAARLSHPIVALAHRMRCVSDGELQVRAPPATNDEIGDLAVVFNRMLDQINELMSSLHAEHRAKVEYELQALFGQINPHFLYNTLASIRFMVGRKSPDEIDSALLAVIRFLKHLFATSSETVSIGEEMEMLAHYEQIQTIRSAGRIRFDINVTPAIRRYTIPKLVLQPLVENAVFHGISTSGEGGVVRVTGYEVGNQIVFEVEGVPTQEPMEELEQPSGGGVALANINERIALFYGNGYGVELREGLRGDRVAELRIPKVAAEIDSPEVGR